MYDAHNNRFEPIPPELAAKFDGPVALMGPVERLQRNWTRFEEGERILVKNILFEVHEIGESRLVLKPVPGQTFA